MAAAKGSNWGQITCQFLLNQITSQTLGGGDPVPRDAGVETPVNIGLYSSVTVQTWLYPFAKCKEYLEFKLCSFNQSPKDMLAWLPELTTDQKGTRKGKRER
jgi:hypothetical protein